MFPNHLKEIKNIEAVVVFIAHILIKCFITPSESRCVFIYTGVCKRLFNYDEHLIDFSYFLEMDHSVCILAILIYHSRAVHIQMWIFIPFMPSFEHDIKFKHFS